MVATWKKDEVKVLSKKIKEASTVGVIRLSGLPSKQLQVMKKTLRGQIDLRAAKRNVIKHSFKKAGITDMDEYLDGSVGLMTSSMNPFQVEKLLEGCKSRAPAKAGWTATEDITVREGDSGLPAGPVIGDLQGAGIKAKIQGGKILIQADSIVVKKGERVDEALATALMRLKIEPVKIKLHLKAAWEDGTIYPYDILHIDEQETLAKLQTAHQSAFNLAYNSRIFTKDTIPLLLQEAFCNARNLAINGEVVNKETVEHFISKADAQARALKSCLPEDLKPAEDAKPAEEAPAKAEEKPAEDAKEEAKVEDVKEEAKVEDVKEEAKEGKDKAPEEAAPAEEAPKE
ncbi:50S ribosomal protein L10 [Candidatus Altiarchaeota archaeon]